MKNSQNNKRLQLLLIVLIAVATLGIGYASITAVNLMINGNATASVSQENFNVYFVTSNITTGTGTASIDENDNTIAYFNITGLTKQGDTAVASYTVLNNSNAVGAEISLQLSNSNNEYFKITETIEDNKLQAGDSTTAIVTVEMIKTPIESNVSTSVTAKLIASPIEDAQASGGETKTKTRPMPYVYTIHKYDGTYIEIDKPISSGVRTFNSFAAAKQEFGHPAVNAHIVEDGKVTESYVVIEKDDKLYYLRGGINETGQENTPAYDTNIDIIKEIYGENWTNYCNETENYYGYGYKYMDCTNNSINLTIRVSSNGSIVNMGSNGSWWLCNVTENGAAACNG